MNYMRYYKEEVHDEMTPADAAADIADTVFSEMDEIDDAFADHLVHKIETQIVNHRSAV